MKYIKATFFPTPCDETTCDVLTAVTADAGFDSFVKTETGIEAYIPKKNYNEESLKEAIADFPIESTKIAFTVEDAEDKDWNAEWEKNYFQPIIIGSRCVVHSTFHTDVPKAEYDIAINPKMSFGTGHHATTNQIIEYLLNANLSNKTVLDMGCGTSILAILASMRGAEKITAIDNDEWCIENSKENLQLNGITNVEVLLGDAQSLGNRKFDIVIANINRNILVQDMASYAETMSKGSHIYMSGFYTEDIPVIRQTAEALGLTYIEYTEQNNWAAIHFEL